MNLKQSAAFLIILVIAVSNISSQTNHSFMFDGLNRSYTLYLPTSYNPGSSNMPLVFVLHGFTQSASSIMNYSGFNDIADNNNFIVVYPEGVNSSWNTNSGAQGSSADDVGFINALIDTMTAKYNINQQKVFSCGLSAGGFMSYRLACELSNRITAVASVAGTMSTTAYNACSPSRNIPIMHIHGTSDLIVNYNGSTGIISVENIINFWKSQNNCPAAAIITNLPDIVNEASTVTKYEYLPCDDNTEVVLLKVNNGGHTWPGAITVSGLGITNLDIDASAEIWDFFSKFSLPSQNISEINAATLNYQLYGNPAETFVLIKASGLYSQEREYNLSDFTGRIIGQGIIKEGDNNIVISYLAKGIYMLKIQGHNGAFKIIKQ